MDHQCNNAGWTKTQDPELFPLDYIPNPLIIIRPKADVDISTGASSDHICIWGLKSCSAISLSAPAQIPKQILYNLQEFLSFLT